MLSTLELKKLPGPFCKVTWLRNGQDWHLNTFLGVTGSGFSEILSPTPGAFTFYITVRDAFQILQETPGCLFQGVFICVWRADINPQGRFFFGGGLAS